MTLIGKVNDARIRSSLIIHDVVVCLDYTATRQLAASKSFWQHALHLHLSAIATSARLASERARVGENEKDPDTFIPTTLTRNRCVGHSQTTWRDHKHRS